LSRLFTEKALTLVLDLDHTLIYSTKNRCKTRSPSFLVSMEDGTKRYVYKRPGLDRFLEDVSWYCEVHVFTASKASYADQIISAIDRNGIIGKRMYQIDCNFEKGKAPVKDLSKMMCDLNSTILIDDNKRMKEVYPNNCINIEQWANPENVRDSRLK
jgi:Dullard-like phosphatase family protein